MYNGITRPNADKGSCIDNMFVKTNIPDIKAFKSLSCITDHYLLILTCNVEKPQSTNNIYYHYMDYKKCIMCLSKYMTRTLYIVSKTRIQR